MSLPGDDQPQNQWQQPQQPYQQGQWQPPPPTSGSATAAVILGVAGIFVCPLICSVLALVFGYKARAEIDGSGGRLGGRGAAIAGIVLGWIGVGFCVVIALLIAALVVV